MQQTSKYKFNLIDTSDTFSPDTLNANTQAVETQLAALAALEAADKSALQTAINTNKSAADTAIKALQADVHPGAKGDIARIATGSYPGTDSFYATNACTLSFDFKPLLVFVFSGANHFTHLMMRPGTYSNAAAYASAAVTWGNQSVTWHVGSGLSAESQCNKSGVTYYWIAIGLPV